MDRQTAWLTCLWKFRGGYNGESSIFDDITKDDLILAFFPCTRFESRIALGFRGELYQERDYSDRQKLEYSMKLHDELHLNYKMISEMVCICLDRGLRMVIENPYTQPHYLTNYWCIKPKIIDKDRTRNGDYMEKPTQFFFINCEPKNNLVFEALDYVPKKRCDYIQGKNRARERSEIHPQYANRFIRQYLI